LAWKSLKLVIEPSSRLLYHARSEPLIVVGRILPMIWLS
jgi:hypothetical protein